MDENNYTYTQPEEEPKKAKKKKRGTPFKVILVILLCCLVAGVLTIGGQTVYERYQTGGFKGIFNPVTPEVVDPKIEEAPIVIVTPTPDTNKKVVDDNKAVDNKNDETINQQKVNSGEDLSAAELYEQNVDAMVSISTSIEGYNAWGQRVQGASAGSGFIVSKDGYILTNAHVIEDANSIKVSTFDDLVYDAELIGYDESNDIAVLKISDSKDFNYVTIGDSDKCRVGEEVVAIGNSLGEFDFSMTRGIISGLARNVRVSSNLTMTLIQTDCTINSGNSGGALFNMKGEVIGITNAKYSSSGTSSSASIENVGFAIPINSVIEIVQAIVSGENLETPYIGVTVSNISTEVANATGIESGAYVAEVTSGGPAEKAGIMAGDIILKAGDAEINEYSDLSSMIAECKPGDSLKIVLSRHGKELTVNVVIGAKKDTNIVMGEDIEKQKQEKEQKNQENQFSYGGNGNSYYGGYGSMPDIFEHIFGDAFGYGYGY